MKTTKKSELVSCFQKFFIINREKYGSYHAEDQKPYTVNSPVIDDVLLRHIKGNITIGVFPSVYSDNIKNCKWLCFDLDCHKSDPVKKEQNFEKMWKIREYLDDRAIYCLVEDSNGEGGIHIWVFFEQLSNESAYLFGKYVLDKLNLKDVEVFPKQKSLEQTEKHIGNWVRLPGKHHKKDHWSRFYQFPDPQKINGKWTTVSCGGEWKEDEEATEMLLNLHVNSNEKMEMIFDYTIRQAVKKVKPKTLDKKIDDVSLNDRISQARNFAKNYKPAVEGQRGDGVLFSLLRNLHWGFDLTPAECLIVCMEEWNDKCSPPWEEKEIYRRAIYAERWGQNGIETEKKGYRIKPDMSSLTTEVDFEPDDFEFDDEPEKYEPFLVHILPEKFKEFIKEISQKQHVDPAIVVSTSFAVISSYLCNVCSVKRKGWYGTVPPTFWCLILLSSGAGKSRGMRPVLSPMTKIESEKRKAASIQTAKNYDLTRQLENKRSKYLKTTGETNISAAINSEEYNEILKQIEEAKYVTNDSMFFEDSTIEALIDSMKNSYNKKTCISGESPFLDLVMGKRYGGGDATLVAIKMWDSDMVHVNRKNSGSTTIENPCLINCSCFTWEAFKKRLNYEEFTQGGFAQRFLYIMPENIYCSDLQEIDEKVLNWWNSIVEDLNISPKEDINHTPKPDILQFTDKAIEDLNKIAGRIVKEQIQSLKDEETELWKGWISRIEAHIVRISSFFHALQYGKDYLLYDIESISVRRALACMKYFCQQGDRILHKQINVKENNAEIIWRHLKKKKKGMRIPLRKIQSSVSRSMTYDSDKTKAETIKSAVRELENQGKPIQITERGRSFFVKIM